MTNEYNVTIYKSLAGRWCVRHPSNHIHHKDFASLHYARLFCKKQGWKIKNVENKLVSSHQQISCYSVGK